MNEFREWLSDNLRYFILGLGILFLMVVIVFGVGFVTRLVGDEEKKSKSTKSQEEAPKENKDLQKEVKDEKEQVTQVEKEVNNLLQTYYKALSQRDIATIKTCVDELNPEEEKRVINLQYIEAYQDLSIFVKEVNHSGAYMGYVSFKMKLKNIDTPYPVLGEHYVMKNSAGKMVIVLTELTEQMKEEMSQVRKQTDVETFVNQVLLEKEKAKEDKVLSNFIKELGIANSKSMEAEDGATIRTIAGCKIRTEASTESKPLETLEAGTAVTKIGVSGEWVQVSYNEVKGYIRADLLE